jgi:hypothetical protein
VLDLVSQVRDVVLMNVYAQAVQAVLDTAGEARVATTGREQAARRGEEDGEARGPTAVAGELQ